MLVAPKSFCAKSKLLQTSHILSMASQSSKKTAAANEQTLKELHLISLAINALALFSLFVFGRPQSKWKYIIFSLPALGCQFVLEKSGRPTFTEGSVSGLKTLSKSGDDIKGPGLFEYMFDCIYITWFCDILMIVFGSNKVWLLLLVIPGFLGYKLFNIGKSFFGGKKLPVAEESAETANAPQGKSKRQTKLEQRGQKQKFRAR